MGLFKDAPKAPDYKGAAEEQSQASQDIALQQTYANRPGQTTPFGSTSWQTQGGVDPATGKPITQWTQNTQLTPELQHALDSQLGLTSGRSDLGASLFPRAQQEFGTPMDWSKFMSAGGVPQATNTDSSQKYYDKAGDAIYNQFRSRMDPRFAQDTEAQDVQLRNRGLKPGDEAYTRAQHDLRQSQNDAYQNAAYQATIGAGQEANRMFGMDLAGNAQNFGQNLQSSQYQTQQRQQQIAEEMQRRGFSLNEINALISGQQVGMPQMPSFMGASAGQAPNYLGAATAQGQADLNAYNSQNALLGSVLGGAGSILGGFLGG